MEQEGARHLTDILHRRTMIGLEPGWGREIHREVAELAAPLLGWSADDVSREVAAHDTYVAERLLGGVATIQRRHGARLAGARRRRLPAAGPANENGGEEPDASHDPRRLQREELFHARAGHAVGSRRSSTASP